MSSADLSSHRIEGFVRQDLGGGAFSMPLHSLIEPASEELGALWQGGCPSTWGPTVLPEGVSAVLNLYGSEYDVPEDVEVRTHPLYDAGDVPNEDALVDLSNWVNIRRQEGKGVLVHCQAGLNRSGLVTALHLIRHRDHTPTEAISLQRARRERIVLCNRTFERYLLDMDPETRLPTAETTTLGA